MAEAFALGDIVQLKSGGLDMIVDGYETQPAAVQHPQVPDRLIRCVWMADGLIQSHVFGPHLLVGEKKDAPREERKTIAA